MGGRNWLELPDSSPYLKIVRPVQKSIVCTFWSTVMSSSMLVEFSAEKCMLRTGRPLNSRFFSNMVTRSEWSDLANSPPSSPGSNSFLHGWRWCLVQVLLVGSCCQKSFWFLCSPRQGSLADRPLLRNGEWKQQVGDDWLLHGDAPPVAHHWYPRCPDFSVLWQEETGWRRGYFAWSPTTAWGPS